MRLIFPVLSALLLFLSFPLYTTGYLAFFVLLPFFYTLSKTLTFRKSFFYGLIFGSVYSLLLSYPIFYALFYNYEKNLLYSIFLVFVASILPNSLLSGIMSLLYIYLRTPVKLLNLFILPSIWVIMDYLKEIIPFLLPWGFAGYTQVYTPFIQVADIVGIYGITFIVVLINSIITEMIIKKKYHQYFLILMIIIIPVLTYSFARTHQINRILSSASPNSYIKISTIQGNFSSKDRWNGNMSELHFNTYSGITDQVIKYSDIIIWPETVLNSADEINMQRIARITSKLDENQYFISGITRKGRHNIFYNSAMLADKNRIIDIYDKMILFPYSESSYSGLSAGRYLNAPEQFEPGKKQKLFKTLKNNIGVTICFESIYPFFTRKLRQSGADYIINLSNDSWFGKTSEPYLHLYANIARAIETRTPVIRSANNGISAIIDQSGEISTCTELDTRTSMTATIRLHQFKSFYLLTGDIILVFCSLIFMISIIMKH